MDDIAAHRWVNIGFDVPPVHGYSPAAALTFQEKKSLTYESKTGQNGHETDSQRMTTIKSKGLTVRTTSRPLTRTIELRSKSLQPHRRTSRDKQRTSAGKN